MNRPRGKYQAPARRANEGLTSTDSPPVLDRNVNDLLHKLRGEHFRHELNKDRTLRKPYSALQESRSYPSLPYGRLLDLGDLSAQLPPSRPSSLPSTAGPIPRSWLPSAREARPSFNSPVWRADALAIFLSHAPCQPILSRVPSLTTFCVHKLLEHYGAGEDLLATLHPYLPLFSRQVLLRETAIYTPLCRASLAVLLGPHGHIGGEAIYIGPSQAKLLDADIGRHTISPEQSDWDLDAFTADDVLDDTVIPSGVALLSAPLRAVHVLPRSLTRLALVHLPLPVPIYLLPKQCPLLEVLDLSFNDWLAPALEPTSDRRRIRWTQWTQLRVLGVRGTLLKEDELERINEGRWVEGVLVEIVT